MDLRNEILKEHSRRQAEYIARYALSAPDRFKALFNLFCSSEEVVAQRAAYALHVCTDEQPNLIVPYIGRLMKMLEKPGIHDAIKRNAMRMLQFIEVSEKHHGTVTDAAFRLLNDRNEAIAIRVFAMNVIFNLSKLYPELGQELCLIIENEMSEGPKPAFVSRGGKILKALNKQ